MDTKTQNKILAMLPAKQSDIWKVLKTDKRKISKILIDMEKNGIIIRKRISTYNINTYLVQRNLKIPTKDMFKKSSLNPKGLLNNNVFSPCTACIDECRPVQCEKLTDWIS